jgi:hypothetical protein
MYTYFLIPALLVIAVAFKYHKKEESPTPEQQLDVKKCIKKAELYADFNPELFKEFVNNLELFDTTKGVDYLKNAVKNINDFSLYTDTEGFEEVFIDDITRELKKYT